MTRRDWVLLALHAADRHRLQPVQIQKTLFLLGQNIGPKRFYRFKAYDYGPFSREIYDDADELAMHGFVEVRPEPGVRWREYVLTEAGAARAAEVAKTAPDEAVAYLAKVVPWAQSLGFKDLVKSIYAHFPEYRARSVFQD